MKVQKNATHAKVTFTKAELANNPELAKLVRKAQNGEFDHFDVGSNTDSAPQTPEEFPEAEHELAGNELGGDSGLDGGELGDGIGGDTGAIEDGPEGFGDDLGSDGISEIEAIFTQRGKHLSEGLRKQLEHELGGETGSSTGALPRSHAPNDEFGEMDDIPPTVAMYNGKKVTKTASNKAYLDSLSELMQDAMSGSIRNTSIPVSSERQVFKIAERPCDRCGEIVTHNRDGTVISHRDESGKICR